MPGSGKTAIIRACANLTKRHVISVNFQEIKTVSQLRNLFYSEEIEVINPVTNERSNLSIPIDKRM